MRFAISLLTLVAIAVVLMLNGFLALFYHLATAAIMRSDPTTTMRSTVSNGISRAPSAPDS